MTIEDIRDASRRSGFKYVTLNTGSENHPKPWVATLESASSGATKRGPRRATAEEAAQDYIDYVNGAGTPVLPAYAKVSVDMGAPKAEAPPRPYVEVRHTNYEGPHDLYDILIKSFAGDLVCRKVGITARGEKRYLDICKTFGMSIEPLNDAVLYPSKKAAKDAEDLLIAKVCSDPKWKRIGKESFFPAGEDDAA